MFACYLALLSLFAATVLSFFIVLPLASKSFILLFFFSTLIPLPRNRTRKTPGLGNVGTSPRFQRCRCRRHSTSCPGSPAATTTAPAPASVCSYDGCWHTSRHCDHPADGSVTYVGRSHGGCCHCCRQPESGRRCSGIAFWGRAVVSVAGMY